MTKSHFAWFAVIKVEEYFGKLQEINLNKKKPCQKME